MRLRTLASVLAAAAILTVVAVPASAKSPLPTLSSGTSATETTRPDDVSRDGKPQVDSGFYGNIEPPLAAASVLYDQYNNPDPWDVPSQDFEAGRDAYDDQAADDFVVPAGGLTWRVTSVEVDGEYSTGPAASVNVFFYVNGPGNLPGALFASRSGNSFVDGPGSGDFVITLTSSVALTAGTYWVSVQARQDFETNGQWFWRYRSVVSNSGAAWRQPGNGSGTGCTTWTRTVTCPNAALRDLVFRLNGYLTSSSILYDQYNNVGTNGEASEITSQDFEAAYNGYDDQAADDFVVPAGQSWSVTAIDVDGRYDFGGPADYLNVHFYANGANNLPGALIASRPGNGYVDGPSPGDFAITLPSPVNLSSGTYWVSVQARQDVVTNGQWFWTYRSLVANNAAAWRNPGNGFGTTCVNNWGRVSTCPHTADNDLVFRLIGSTGPTITSVTPIAGPTGGGQTVTILGTRFGGTSAVTFGGVAASSFSVVSPTRITAVTPAHAAGMFHVRVTTPVGTSTIVPADYFTYQGLPTISSVTPNAGPTGGGRTVTILGTNFTGANWLTFGTVAATSFTVISPTKITAVTPAHAAGLTNVRVNTPSGTSAIVAADQYTFQGPPTISSVAPNNGPTAGGQTVIILGTNFTATNQVYFGGVAATSFTVNSATRITALTPAHAAGMFHVRVNTPVGMSAAVPADQYTFN